MTTASEQNRIDYHHGTISLILFAYLLSPCHGQKQIDYHLTVDSLSNNDNEVWLRPYWRVHAGDNSAWSAASYNDAHWANKPSTLPADSSASYNWEGIGWFRRNLRVDSSIANQALGFYFRGHAAAENFIKGAL